MARHKAAEAKLQDERARAPTPDDGYNGPSQDVFLASVRETINANQALADARAARAAMRKRAKAAGIELAKMDAVILMADWTPAEVRDHFRISLRYARFMELPIGAELDLFEGMTDDAVSEKDAESMGFIAATTGKGSFGEPPAELHPTLHPAWLRGLHRGTAANGAKITPEPEAPKVEAVAADEGESRPTSAASPVPEPQVPAELQDA